MSQVGLVAIGRNEGERLCRCLASVGGRGLPIVYIDSGSTDGSPEAAAALGADVVMLDRSLPYSAARSRNAGFERLLEMTPDVRYVMFVDGDCEVVEGWLDRARRELESRPDAAVVCGRRRERFPDASIYNRLQDIEWDTPVGEARSCGGDAMFRVGPLREAGGYDPSVSAGEEPELCQRLREKEWKVLRIDAEMTLHDAAIVRFAQWFRRFERNGYGAMDVATRFRQGPDPLFVRQVHSARLWAIGWPAAMVVGLLLGLIGVGLWLGWGSGLAAGLVLGGLVFLAAPAQMLRLALRMRRRVGDWRTASAYGILTIIGKWGHVNGQRKYFRDRAAGRNTRLIDYKTAGQSSAPRPAAS